MIFLGVDPGKDGGLALVGDGAAEATRMPETIHDIVNWLDSARLTANASIELCHVEKVGPVFRPGTQQGGVPGKPKFGRQGMAKQSFAFGRGYGMLLGILAAFGVSYEEVSPQRWQKFFGTFKGSRQKRKAALKARAQALFPHLKVTLYTCDALLLAERCRRLNQLVRQPEAG